MKRLCYCLFALGLPALAAAGSLPILPDVPPTTSFSFAVLGDNRGDDSGEQPPTFLQVLQAMSKESFAFVLDTGDMIYGLTPDEEKLREEWRRYHHAVDRIKVPIFHVPGNHDLFDRASARIYHELWGPSFYSFVHGNSKFIGLDTETTKNEITGEQFAWLTREFQTCAQSNVFLFFHCPLFPVDGAVGSSLDRYPAKRDQLHALFTQYRRLVRGVFCGHEHLYDFQERDGIPYYISGGGGAPLYTAPELGGFRHFLIVTVNGTEARVTLKRVCAPSGAVGSPRKIRSGEVLESWNQGYFWYAWDRAAAVELTREQATQGEGALRLNYDLTQYAWPVLALSLAASWNLKDCESLKMDVYVPEDSGTNLKLTAAIQGAVKSEAPSVNLKGGWNTVVTRMDEKWLSARERTRVQGVEWSVSGENGAQGHVVFDNFRSVRKESNQDEKTDVLESWERPLLWRLFDETVTAETSDQGLLLHLDWLRCKRPILFAQANPPFDLTQIGALELQMDPAQRVPNGLCIGLSLRSRDRSFAAPVQRVMPGAARLVFQLDPNWLPANAREAVEQIAFRFTWTSSLRDADLRFKRLTAVSGL